MIHKFIIENDIENVEWRLECGLEGKTSSCADEIVKSVTLTGVCKTTGKEYKASTDGSKSDGEHDGFFEHICEEVKDNIGTAEWFLRGLAVEIGLGLWSRLRKEMK